MSRALAVAVLVVSVAAQAALPDSLTLDEALTLARVKQPSLAQARAQLEASSARARQAFAPLLPTVSSSESYTRQTANFVPRPGAVPSTVAMTTAISLSSSDFWNASVTAQWTAWDFGQNSNRYLAAQLVEQSQAAQLRVVELAVDLQVRTTFFLALAKRDLVAVAEATLKNTEAHLAQVDGFVRVGTRPEIDLAQSRSDKANARLLLVNAKNDYAIARARLNQAVGVEGVTTYAVVGGPPSPLEHEDAAVDALMPEAFKARPELAALDAQLQSQAATQKSLHAAYFPTLGLQLGGTLGAAQLDKTVPNLNGQVTLSWPVYQGGLTTAQEREAAAVLAQLQAQLAALRLQVRLDVEQASLALGAAKESVDVAQEARVAAEERLRLAEGRYKAGAGSSIELGDAQIAFTTAAAQQVQAMVNLASARAQLQAALGRR